MRTAMLPDGYRLGADPDLLRLTRRDGTEAVVFSADGATAEKILKTAWSDRRRSRVLAREGEHRGGPAKRNRDDRA